MAWNLSKTRAYGYLFEKNAKALFGRCPCAEGWLSDEAFALVSEAEEVHEDLLAEGVVLSSVEAERKAMELTKGA